MPLTRERHDSDAGVEFEMEELMRIRHYCRGRAELLNTLAELRHNLKDIQRIYLQSITQIHEPHVEQGGPHQIINFIVCIRERSSQAFAVNNTMSVCIQPFQPDPVILVIIHRAPFLWRLAPGE